MCVREYVREYVRECVYVCVYTLMPSSGIAHMSIIWRKERACNVDKGSARLGRRSMCG